MFSWVTFPWSVLTAVYRELNTTQAGKKGIERISTNSHLQLKVFHLFLRPQIK